MKKICIVTIFIIGLVNSQSCAPKLTASSFDVYASTAETMRWGLRDVFFSGENLVYSISDSSATFSVTQPSELIATKATPTALSIVASASLTQTNNGAWLNSWAVLDKKGSVATVLMALGTPSKDQEAPNFSSMIQLDNQEGNNCQALAYLTQDSVIVDCIAASNMLVEDGVFHIVNQDGKIAKIKSSTPNNLGYTSITKRIIQVMTKTSLNRQVTYIFRGVPSSGTTQDRKQNSAIEVFVLDDNNVPQPTGSVLDSATLAIISGDLTATFNLVDFKVAADGYIYVLDASMKLYRLSFTNNGQWHYSGKIEQNSAQPFAFTINNQLNSETGGYTTHVAILYYNYFVLYEWSLQSSVIFARILFVYDIPLLITDTFVGTFEISQNFVILQSRPDNTLLLFDISSTELITKIDINPNLNILVNPYQQTLVTFADSKSELWRFSQGELVLNSVDQPKASTGIILTATSTDGSSQRACSIPITFQVFDRKDSLVYPIKNQQNPLPQEVSYPTQLVYPVEQLATGPNVQYQQNSEQPKDKFLEGQLKDDTSVKSYSVWQLDMTKIQFPQPADVIFVDILTIDDPFVFYQIMQTKDLAVTVWSCRVQQGTVPSDQTSCEVKGALTSKVALSQKTFQSWTNFDQATLALLDDNYNLNISICDEGECQVVHTFTYPAVVGEEIQSFLFLNNNIWIVRSAKKTLEVYQLFQPFTLVLTIDQTTIKSYGYSGEWAPQEAYGNKIMNPALVFIQNKANLIIADFHAGLSLLTVIDYDNPNNSVEVSVADKTFFLAQLDTTGTQQSLREYNFENTSNIHLQKDFYLYWYTFQLPLQAEFSAQNGYFFIRVLCQKCEKTVILVYRPNQLSRDALFRVVGTELLVENGKPIVMAPGGDSNMYLYVNIGTSQKTHSVLRQPLLAVTPQVNANDFITTSKLSLKVYNFNFDDSNSFIVDQTTKVLNTFTDVKVNQDALSSNSKLTFKNKAEVQIVSLPDNLYTGQALTVEIECADCTKDIKDLKNITINNHVQPTIAPISLQGASDFDSWPGTDIKLAIMDNKIYFLRNNVLAYPIVTLETPSKDFKCTLIGTQSDGLYIVSICSDSFSYYASFISCLSVGRCFSAGYAELPGVQFITKFALMGSSLVILNTNWQNPLAFDGSVILFEIKNDDQEWILTKYDEVKTTDPANPLYISDFDIQGLFDIYYQCYFTTSNGLLMKGGFMNSDSFQFIKMGDDTKIDLKAFLNSPETGQVATDNTLFLGVKAIGSKIIDDKFLTTTIIFTTSNVAHYQMVLYSILSNIFQQTMKFDVSDILSQFKLLTKTLDYSFNRYGNWPTVNKLRVKTPYLVIPYRDTVTEQVVVAQYLIPNTPSTPTNDLTATIPNIQITGGSSKQLGYSEFNNLCFTFQDINNVRLRNITLFQKNTQLLTNSDSYFQMNQQLSLSIRNGGDLNDQDIKFIFKNDFSNDEVTSHLSSVSSSSSEGGLKWWGILLIILGVLIIIGIVAMIVYKKKKSGVHEELLGQVQRDQLSNTT